MNITNKKIALIYGQGIEGCGVTKNGYEMQVWAKKAGVKLDIFELNERKYARTKSHKIEVSSFSIDKVDIIREKLETYDIVIFNSYPTAKYEHHTVLSFYYNLIEKLKNPIKVGFMHELIKSNINKIPMLIPIMNQMDLIYNFSEETWFSNTISTLLPSKKIGQRVNKFTMWVNFDEMLKFRRPLSEKKKKTLCYVSRWTTMKDPRRVIDIGYKMLKIDPEWETVLHGIEASMGAKIDIIDHPHSRYHYTNGRIVGDGPIDVWHEYKYEFGMDFLSKNLFGASFYRMPKLPEGYGNRMEYAQIEIIAAGSIPVFDTHWGTHNSIISGEKYIDIPYSAIYSEKNEIDATVEKLLEVSSNKNLQQKYIETGIDLIQSEFNADNVMPSMIREILNAGKDDEKFETIDDIIIGVLDNIDFVKEYKRLKEKNQLVALGIKNFTNNTISVFEDKKDVEVKKWKKSKIEHNSKEVNINNIF